jgi:TPR repeat protein
MKRSEKVAFGLALLTLTGALASYLLVDGSRTLARGDVAPTERIEPPSQAEVAVPPTTVELVPEDSTNAVRQCREGAERGDAKAQLELGDRLHSGTGLKRDLAQAAMWYRKSAEQGVADAQFALAMCYVTGSGVERDLMEALEWMKKATAGGHAEARTRSLWLQIEVKRLPPGG